MLKSDTIEPLAEQVALGGIEVEDFIVIAVVEGDVSMGINLKISRCNSRLWEVYSFFGVGTRLRTGEVNPLFGFENVIEAGLVGAGSNVYSSIRETMEEKKGKCQDK